MKTTLTGKIINVSKNLNYKRGNMTVDGFYFAWIKLKSGRRVRLYVSQKALLYKTYSYNTHSEKWEQTGIPKPIVGMKWEVHGSINSEGDYMNNITKILKS